MSDDTTAPFLFPATERTKVIADFDGGRITFDGGVMLLAASEPRLAIAKRLVYSQNLGSSRTECLVTIFPSHLSRLQMRRIQLASEITRLYLFRVETAQPAMLQRIEIKENDPAQTLRNISCIFADRAAERLYSLSGSL